MKKLMKMSEENEKNQKIKKMKKMKKIKKRKRIKNIRKIQKIKKLVRTLQEHSGLNYYNIKILKRHFSDPDSQLLKILKLHCLNICIY